MVTPNIVGSKIADFIALELLSPFEPFQSKTEKLNDLFGIQTYCVTIEITFRIKNS